MPTVSVYADGRILTPGAVDAIYPGPRLPPVSIKDVGPAGAAVLMLLCSIGQWFSHYPFEVKHYTSDIFWALLLPALARC